MHAGIHACVRHQRRASLASVLRMQETCVRCKVDKELDEFSSKGDGRVDRTCKTCRCAGRISRLEGAAAQRASGPDEPELCRHCGVPKPAAQMSKSSLTTCMSCYKADRCELGACIVSRLANRLDIACAAKGATVAGPVRGMFGCSVKELAEHFAKMEYDGMDLIRDWSDVHIDHIKPCRKFNMHDPEEQRRCFNYRNMQVLWPRDNLCKSDGDENIRSFKNIKDRKVIEAQIAAVSRVTGTTVREVPVPASVMCTCILGACTVHRASK